MARTLANKKKLKSIPNIKGLRDELDYGHSHNARDIEFYRAVRAYRSSYKTRGGISGEFFNQWKDPFHQGGLGEMTEDFLHRDGNGVKYWPDDENSPYFGRFCFSKDSARIQRLMKELFFRINQQRGWASRRSNSQPECQRGGSADQPIEVDDLPDSNTKSPHLRETSSSTSSAPKMSYHAPGVTDEEFEASMLRFTQGVLDGMPNLDQNDTSYNGGTMPDPYEIPLSPKESTSGMANVKKRLFAEYNENLHHLEDLATSKRAKNQDEPTTHPPAFPQVPVLDTINAASLFGDKPGLPSSRVRKRRHDPDFVSSEDMDLTDSDVVDSVESDLYQPAPATSPQAPVALMHRQDTEETARPQTEEQPQQPSMAMPPPPLPRPEPPRPSVPLYSFLRNDFRAQSEPVSQAQNAPRLETRLPQPRAVPSCEAGRTGVTNTEQTTTCPADTQTNAPADVPTNTPVDTLTDGPASATASDRQKSEDTLKSKPTSSSNSKPAVPPKINLNFLVQTSRRDCTIWDMKGSFQQKTLKDLISELQIEGSFTGFSLILSTPKLSFNGTVNLGDEDGFQEIKDLFRRKIKECLKLHKVANGGSGPRFEISIVPLWAEEQDDDDDDDDDDDFDY